MDLQQLQQGLQHVKLRNAHSEMRDCSKPKLTGFVDDKVAKVYQTTCLDANIEFWYPLVEELTFPTKFVPLSQEEGQFLIRAYEEFEQHQKKQAVISSEQIPFVPSDEITKSAAALAAKIDAAIDKQVDGTTQPVFVKLSSRSAKDAAVTHPKIRQVLSERMQVHRAKSEEIDDNIKMHCMLEAGLEVMKVHCGADAVSLFLRSERAYQDMLLARDHLDRWQENIVIRQWVDVPVDMEFRGFVHKGKLTALSQYNHMCYFANVEQRAQEIETRIKQFFETKVKDLLAAKNFESYVIDFALSQDDKIWVIELNPFLDTTDGALFSWTQERPILENGPFEFRFRTSKSTGQKAVLASSWRSLLEQMK